MEGTSLSVVREVPFTFPSLYCVGPIFACKSGICTE